MKRTEHRYGRGAIAGGDFSEIPKLRKFRHWHHLIWIGVGIVALLFPLWWVPIAVSGAVPSFAFVPLTFAGLWLPFIMQGLLTRNRLRRKGYYWVTLNSGITYFSYLGMDLRWLPERIDVEATPLYEKYDVLSLVRIAMLRKSLSKEG